MMRAWVLRALPWASAAVMVAVILAYAGLLPRARWQGDEYITISFMRDLGWPFYKNWYLHWSPRLISDILFITYGNLVTTVHRPLAPSCLALLWLGLLVACAGPGLVRRGQRVVGVLAGLTIFALFLLGHGVAEVFYWPAGGLTYLPTLAGAAWLFWCLEDPRGEQRGQAACALTLIAGCSEVGVFLALSVCGCMVLARIRTDLTGLWWLLPGLFLAVVDLGLVLRGRVGTAEFADGNPLYLHHAGASLVAAIPQFFRELIAPPNSDPSLAAQAGSALSRLLVLAGARWCLSNTRSGRALLMLACAFALASFGTLAAALYEFGKVCCQRQDTMRACFILLGLVCLGAWSSRCAPARSAPAAGAVAWGCAALLLFVPSVPALTDDYKTLPQAIRAHAATWRSGLSDQSGSMQMTLDPGAQAIESCAFPPGKFTRGKGTPWYDEGIMMFFDKKELVIDR